MEPAALVAGHQAFRQDDRFDDRVVGEYCFRWGQYHELPPADIQQAIRWYARGARMNHMGCTTMLGKIHLALGHRSKAEDWLTRTAQPHSFGGTYGDSLAQWFLAEMNFQ